MILAIYLFGILCAWPAVSNDDDLGYGPGLILALVWPWIVGLRLMKWALGTK